MYRAQPVGHGVELSVPICRCEKKIFSAIKKQKRLYDSYSKDWLDLLNTAWIVKIHKAFDFLLISLNTGLLLQMGLAVLRAPVFLVSGAARPSPAHRSVPARVLFSQYITSTRLDKWYIEKIHNKFQFGENSRKCYSFSGPTMRNSRWHIESLNVS